VKAKESMNAYREKLKEIWEELPPIFSTSSEKRIGRDELLNYIETINKTL
jgi:GTP-binding protein